MLTSPLTRKTLVTPAKAGVQNPRGLDSGLRRNDDKNRRSLDNSTRKHWMSLEDQ